MATGTSKSGAYKSGSKLVLSVFYDTLRKLRSGKTLSNAREAERQTDVLLSATCSLYSLEYEPEELRECIKSAILLLDDNCIAVVLLEKLMKLLENLASDDCLKFHMFDCKLMEKLYNNLKKWKSKSHNDTTLLQTLTLLCCLTDGVVIKCPDGVVEDVIEYLISIIKAGSCDEMAVLCMEVLANMCRRSESVRSYIKGKQSIKAVQKCLIGHLSQGQLAIIVTSLHILASLCLYDHLGESLFNSKNVDQTFQVAFSVLLKSPNFRPKARAVDLLVDITQCERVQTLLYQYHSLSQFINSAVLLLPSADGKTFLKFMELFVAFMQVRGIRGLLCKQLLKIDDHTKLPEQQNLPFSSIVGWACNRSQYPKSTLIALDFLSDLFEEVIDADLNSVCFSYAEFLVQNLMQNIPFKQGEEDNRHRTFSIHRVTKTLSVLLTLSSSALFAGLLGQQVNGQSLSALIQMQLSHNPAVLSQVKEEQYGTMMSGLDIFLKSTLLAIKLKAKSSNFEEILLRTVADDRVMKLIAKAFSIPDQKCVQTALLIVQEGCLHSSFHLENLANHITANIYRLDKCKTQSQDYSAVAENSCSLNHNATESPVIPFDTNEVDALLERFKNDVELKDAKSSEIMQIYDYKLKALTTKEGHLQDLLEAKALALSQADRLIAQYRGRRAQAESECVKLRNLLQQSEKYGEELKEKLSEVTANSDANVEKMRILNDENKMLKSIAEEKSKLSIALQEQTAEIEQYQCSVIALTNENKKLLDINQELKKQMSSIQLQHDHTILDLENLGKERQNFLQVLAENEQQIQELQSSVSKLSQQCDEYLQNKTSLEENIKALNTELSIMQRSNHSLTEEISQIRNSCNSLEKQLLHSNQIIQHQKCALEQHTQMVTKIHELTSNPSKTSLEDTDL